MNRSSVSRYFINSDIFKNLLRCILIVLMAAFYCTDGVLQVHAQRTSAVVPNTVTHSFLKTMHQRSGFLSAYNDSPLDNRTPLILIHGLGEKVRNTDRNRDGETHWFHWDNFLTYLAKRPDFQKKYKIYFYHYDSARSIPILSKDLQQSLTQFINQLEGQNIKVVAYSEGGLLIRNVLQDPYLDAHTLSVLTIATPFHGSPLANPAWIREQCKSEQPFSLIRLGNPLIYAITQRLYPSFREDFHWDNFDGTLPNIQQDKQSIADLSLLSTKYSLAKKKNFITYGSYFGKEVDPSFLKEQLGIKKNLPKERLVFGNIFRRNILFSLVRNTIGKLPLIAAVKQSKSGSVTSSASNNTVTGTILTVKPIDAAAQSLPRSTDKDLAVATGKALVVSPSGQTLGVLTGTSIASLPIPTMPMMMFNDGISPISSTLWLGRFTQQSQGACVSADNLWSALKSLKGNGHARLFPGLDHRNWMDGTNRTKEAAIQDLLNPTEPPRSIFDWIVYDLG